MPQTRPGAHGRKACNSCGSKPAELSCNICACEELVHQSKEAYCSVECFRAHFASVHYVSGGAPLISQIVDRGSSRSESSISSSSTSSRRSSPSMAMSPTSSPASASTSMVKQESSPPVHASPLTIRRPGAASEWTRSGSPMRANCTGPGVSRSLGESQQQGLELTSSKLAHLVPV